MCRKFTRKKLTKKSYALFEWLEMNHIFISAYHNYFWVDFNFYFFNMYIKELFKMVILYMNFLVH
jgi:hypothetical protein